MGPRLPQVDVGVITILDSEFEALHRRLPAKPDVCSARREYNVCSVPTRNGDRYVVALARCLEQGTAEAQNLARDLIEDLDPQWLFVVGIGGGVPVPELTLGDVVVSNRVHDFRVEAVAADHRREYDVGGGPLLPGAARIIANLPGRRDDLGSWSSRASIGTERPRLELRDEAMHGDDEWRGRIRESLRGHSVGDEHRDPIFVTAPVASSDRLVKDADVIRDWLRAARRIRAVDMEAAGVYHAAWARSIPAIAIRGISDIVGFERDDAWVAYACQSAAAFTMAFLQLGAFPSRARRGRAPPPSPRYADPATEELCKQLALALERKAQLEDGGQSTAAVVREILQLRRELRDGGQLRAGDALDDGRFLLVEQIGQGGFAFVWRAFDTARSRDVAIKVLHANLAGDRLRVERFFRGARIMAEFDHPSVVRVLAREGHELGFHFFVMEYVSGGNLASAVLRKQLTRAQILAAIYAVGDALAVAHARGYVHRDVKPQNILLAPDLSARLTDFDLVGAADTTGGTRTGMMGTFLYAAPELLERPQDADGRADVYGLAMTLVFALHGAEPRAAWRNLDRFIDDLDCSADMKALLKHAIAADPAERTPDIASFCLALSALPEVRDELATNLCSAEASHLLEPFIRLHDRVVVPADVAGTVELLRHHRTGRVAEAAGDPGEAGSSYRRALELRSDHVPTLSAHARILADAARWEDHVDMAVKLAEAIGDRGRSSAVLLATASICEEHLRNPPRALSLYEAVLRIEPGNALATTRLEILLRNSNEFKRLAESLLARADHTTDVQDAVAALHEAAGIYENELRDHRSAFEVLKTALNKDRYNETTASLLERVATTAGMWLELVTEVASGDNCVALLEWLAAVCGGRGEWRRAVNLLVQAASDAQVVDRVGLLNAAGGIYLDRLREPDAAQRMFAEVMKLDSEHVEAGLRLAELYYRDERWAALSPVIEMLVRKIAVTQSDAHLRNELYFRAARTADALGDSDKALGYYYAAYDVDATHVPTLIGLADLLYNTGDHEHARPLYETAVSERQDALSGSELVHIYHRLGLIHLKLGDRKKALDMMEKLIELKSTHRAALGPIGELYREQGNWGDAIRVMRDLAVDTSGKEKVQLLSEIGAIYRDKLHEPWRAMAVYREALVLAPDDDQLLRSLLALYRETEQWNNAIATIQEILRHVSGKLSAKDEVQLLSEIGDIYHDKLMDSHRAIDAYLEALALAPDDDQFHRKLLDLYTETRRWGKAIDIIEKLVALASHPVQRGKYYHAAATICQIGLSAPERAIAYYNKALDSFFAYPERLPEALIPTVLRSFDALDSVLVAKRDWNAEARAYRDMIGRLPNQGSPEFRKALVGLLDRLGEVYRLRLKDYSAAAGAVEIAQQLDPSNEIRAVNQPDRTEILAELYLATGTDDADKAVQQHVRMLHNNPLKYDSYKALRRIYMDTDQRDKAWCVCNALAFLDQADSEELQFYERNRPRDLLKTKKVMSPGLWTRLIHPDEDCHISAVLAACWQSIATMKALPHKDFGIRRKDRRLLDSDRLPLSRLLYDVAQLLAVQLPELYVVNDDNPMDIQLVNAIEKNELCPSFVVRPRLLQGKSERSIAFLLARQLTFLRPEYYLRMFLPTRTDLEVALASAIALVEPRFPIRLAPLVEQQLPELRNRASPHLREQLGATVKQILQAGRELDLGRWGSAVDATADRAGLVACGDLTVAARMIPGERLVGVDGPEVTDLLLFSVSEDYFAVRRQLGLTIAA